MRAKWMWSSWANLTLSLMIALELLFIVFSMYFIYPKFSGLLAAGFIDGEFLRKAGRLMDADVPRAIGDRGREIRVVDPAGSGGGDRPLRVACQGREQIADAILRWGPRPWACSWWSS